MRDPRFARRLPALAALAASALTAAPFPQAAAVTPRVAGFVVFWVDGTSARTLQRDYLGCAVTYFDTALLVKPDRVVNQIPAWVAGFVRRHHNWSQICVANDPGPDFDGAMLHKLLTSPADEQQVIS